MHDAEHQSIDEPAEHQCMDEPAEHQCIDEPSLNDLIPILKVCVKEILKADGDRDYMCPSNLTVQQTLAIADFVRCAIQKLAAVPSS